MTTFTETADGGDPWLVQPRALIVTIYGLYARDTGGWLSVASLIRLMAELGVDEPAVRSSISRLKRRGVLEPRRGNGARRATACPAAAATSWPRATGGSSTGPRARLADGWVLAVFSVPEPERRRRHELRSRLTWLGFGTVSAGVWIAPATSPAETAEVLERCGLSGYVTLFRADYQAFGDLREQIPHWWDPGRLQHLYQASSTRPGRCWPAAGRDRARRRRSPTTSARSPPGGGCRSSTPGLPAELLPDGWNGLAADRAFTALRERLADPARAHVLAVTGVSR